MIKVAKRKTRVLFVNPMWGMEGFLPIGLSSLIGLLRENKFDDSGKVRVSELLERLGQFDENPSQFLTNLLAAQCFLGEADAGAILCSNTEGRIDVLAIYPLLQRGSAVPQCLEESDAESTRDGDHRADRSRGRVRSGSAVG